jgi:hypothetical protein
LVRTAPPPTQRSQAQISCAEGDEMIISGEMQGKIAQQRDDDALRRV